MLSARDIMPFVTNRNIKRVEYATSSVGCIITCRFLLFIVVERIGAIEIITSVRERNAYGCVSKLFISRSATNAVTHLVELAMVSVS